MTISASAPYKDNCVKQKGSRKRKLPEPPPGVAERLEELLPADVLDDVLAGLGPEEITGSGGLLTALAGRVVEAALAAELTGHLGYEAGQAPPGGAPNSRNGATPKTLATELGEVRIRTPRDRDASFEPQLVRKRQARLAGLDDRVLDLYAGGMSTRDIAAHLTELYGTPVGRDTISRVTSAVAEDVAAWRSRPLEAVYPVVYFDAMRVRSVRTAPCRTAPATSRWGSRWRASASRWGSGGKTTRARNSGWASSTTCISAASPTS